MRSLLLVSILLLAAASAQAADLFVNPDGSGLYPTIQAAIDAANNNDTVVLMPGTFTGPGNRDVEVDFTLTIRSNDLNNRAVIDCQGSAAEPHRGFNINDGDVILDHLIIRNGYATNGGTLYVSGPQATLTHCLIEGSTATGMGGAVYTDGADLVHMDHTVLADNSAGTQGGAVYHGPGEALRLFNCTVVRNEAPSGAGVYYTDSELRLNSTIVAYNLGGAAVEDYYGTGYVIGCTDIFGNQGGDWTGSLAGQLYINNNVRVDPMLCDPMGSPANYAVMAASPVGDGFACGALGAMPADAVWPTPIYGVTDDGNGMFATIQAAINATPLEAEIALEDGVYTGLGNRNIGFLGKPMIVRSRSGNRNSVVIDAEGTTEDYARHFKAVAGEPVGTEIRDLTLRGGMVYDDNAQFDGFGGSLQILGNASLKVDNVVFADNFAQLRASVIYMESPDGFLEINNCLFSGNTGQYSIAGYPSCIILEPGTLTMNGCEFDQTNASDPLRVHSDQQNITVSDCYFGSTGATSQYFNRLVAVHPGLGSLVQFTNCDFITKKTVYVQGDGQVVFDDCRFSIPNDYSTGMPFCTFNIANVDLNSCSFVQTNPLNQTLCAIAGFSSTLNFSNCDFTGFTNLDRPGIVDYSNGHLTFDNCRFTDNHNGIFLVASFEEGLTVTNSIFDGQEDWCLDVATISGPVMLDNNQFLNSGGGARFTGVQDLTILGSHFESIAVESGISLIESNADIRNSHFSGNSSTVSGAGLSGLHSNLNLETCTFQNNSTTVDGGAIAFVGGYSAITDCTFELNSSDGNGGAIHWNNPSGTIPDNADVNIYNSGFSGNQSTLMGGALFGEMGSLQLENCNLENNQGSQGGSFHAHNLVTTIVGSTFRGNSALYGGAISGFLGEMNILSTDVVANTANQHGGIYLNGCSSALLDHCLVAENTVSARGSGIGIVSCSPTILSCTIAGNGGSGSWGQIACEFTCAPSLNSTIIAYGLDGPAMYTSHPELTTVTAGCLDVVGNPGGDYAGPLTGFDTVNNNISLDPLFCHASAGNFYLASSSPCAAVNNACGDDGGTFVGAFDVGCSGVSPVPEQQEIPRSFVVLGNFPNPFNPQTDIAFALPTDGPVTVAIYDVTGRLVRQLVGGESYRAGNHQVTWDGRDGGGQIQSSGIYLYRVTAEGTTLGGKMAMVR